MVIIDACQLVSWCGISIAVCRSLALGVRSETHSSSSKCFVVWQPNVTMHDIAWELMINIDHSRAIVQFSPFMASLCMRTITMRLSQSTCYHLQACTTTRDMSCWLYHLSWTALPSQHICSCCTFLFPSSQLAMNKGIRLCLKIIVVENNGSCSWTTLLSLMLLELCCFPLQALLLVFTLFLSHTEGILNVISSLVLMILACKGILPCPLTHCHCGISHAIFHHYGNCRCKSPVTAYPCI